MEVEAVQWTGRNWGDLEATILWSPRTGPSDGRGVQALYVANEDHGLLKCQPGQWLIRHPDGEYSIMNPGAFAAKYEPISDG